MFRWIPDWILYALTLGIILYVVFLSPSEDSPPPHPDALEQEGAMLPPASVFDERVLVQVTKPKTGIGTAFAINEEGNWLTARHVVEGCDQLGLLVAPGQYAPVDTVNLSSTSDLALLKTEYSPYPAALNTQSDLRVGTHGYHVGYPQGRPGEAASRLLARSNLITSGLRSGSETVLTWAETGRTKGLMGSLAGLSGGPVYDKSGVVRGVIVAESPRRGRIYSASPEAVGGFIESQGVTVSGERPRAFAPDTYGEEADYARRNLQVVKVACTVGDE